MTRKFINGSISTVLALTLVACADANRSEIDTTGGTSRVSRAGATTGGTSAAITTAAACPPTLTVDPRNCHWSLDRTTREWALVCTVGSQTVVVDTSGLTRARRDSAGVRSGVR
jgi:hypothetical protein